VEYKIFGADQRPPDDFKEDLAAFFRLDDQQRNVIAEWFLSTRDYELHGPSLPPAVVASTLLPEQFWQTAGVIRQLLISWQRYGLELEDVERDLFLLGLGPEQLKILSVFLTRLSPIREQIWLDTVEGAHCAMGLPTIDDVNILWDARPLFGGLSYYSYKADGDAPYSTFLGLTYLATVEIITSDIYGRNQRTAIQLDEDGFQRLLRGMRRAGEQLDILKDRTKTVVPDAKAPKRGE
jgi:hypothetical protein